MCEVSKHAEKRMRERIGINKRSVQRMADKAYEKGIPHSQTRGYLRKWITKIYFNNPKINNPIVYGDKLFLFANNILVTILPIPQYLIKDKNKRGH